MWIQELSEIYVVFFFQVLKLIVVPRRVRHRSSIRTWSNIEHSWRSLKELLHRTLIQINVAKESSSQEDKGKTSKELGREN